MKTTGQLIEELLDKKNMTQRHLAEQVGVSEVTISRYINGARTPKITILKQIAGVLDVSVDYLIGETPQATPIMKQPSKKDKEKLEDFLENARGHFMDVDDNDKDKIMKALQDIFWETKALNREKYNPYKNKNKTKK
jgi:transcriptional regulator with XRE-family HTH domain